MSNDFMNMIFNLGRAYFKTENVEEKGEIYHNITLILGSIDSIPCKSAYAFLLRNYSKLSTKCKKKKGPYSYAPDEDSFYNYHSYYLLSNFDFLKFIHKRDFRGYSDLKLDDTTEIHSLVCEFFKETDPRLYSFYCELLSKRDIIVHNKLQEPGNASTIPMAGHFPILLKKLDSVDDFCVLVHEVAHTYYSKVCGINHFKDFSYDDINKSEIFPSYLNLSFIGSLFGTKFHNEACDELIKFDNFLNEAAFNLTSSDGKINREYVPYAIGWTYGKALYEMDPYSHIDATSLCKYINSNSTLDIINNIKFDKNIFASDANIEGNYEYYLPIDRVKAARGVYRR